MRLSPWSILRIRRSMDGFKGTDVVAEFCEFLPFSGVVVNNKNFRTENHDSDPDDPKSTLGVLHNPHSFVVKGSSSATGFNIGLAKKGDKLEKPVHVPRRRGEDRHSIACSATSMSSCSPSSSRCGIPTMRW